MSITPFLRNEAFEPELIDAMSAALSKARFSLGLLNEADPMTEIVARHIIDAARRGMRSSTALYFSALNEFKSKPQ